MNLECYRNDIALEKAIMGRLKIGEIAKNDYIDDSIDEGDFKNH